MKSLRVNLLQLQCRCKLGYQIAADARPGSWGLGKTCEPIQGRQNVKLRFRFCTPVKKLVCASDLLSKSADLRSLPPVSECITNSFGDTFAGLTNISKSGWPCEPWVDVIRSFGVYQTEEEIFAQYPVVRGAGSACRNPDFDSEGPWCYVRRGEYPAEGRNSLLLRESVGVLQAW